MTGDWVNQFPGLSALDTAAQDNLRSSGRIVSLPGGAVIFGPGQAPANFLMLVDGVIRVQQTGENGREIVLYRVAAGESCALTSACLMGYSDYRAEGIAETAIKAVAFPRPAFDELIASSAAFRRFVFTGFSERVTALCRVIEDVAFSRLDIRLAERLLQRMDGERRVTATHQELAAELGTAREVVSRQLQEFQRRGWIAQGRGQIAVAGDRALRQLAANAGTGFGD